MRLLFDYIRYNRRRVILGGYGGVAPSEKKHRTPSSERLHTRHSRPDFCGFHALGNGWVTKSNSRLGGVPLPLVIRPCLPLPRARGAAPCSAYNTLHLTLFTRHAYDLTLPAATAHQRHHTADTTAAPCPSHQRGTLCRTQPEACLSHQPRQAPARHRTPSRTGYRCAPSTVRCPVAASAHQPEIAASIVARVAILVIDITGLALRIHQPACSVACCSIFLATWQTVVCPLLLRPLACTCAVLPSLGHQ